MKVVIQCAARKNDDAGHMMDDLGRQVMFVANPGMVEDDPSRIYRRPDDEALPGISWRTMVPDTSYN